MIHTASVLVLRSPGISASPLHATSDFQDVIPAHNGNGLYQESAVWGQAHSVKIQGPRSRTLEYPPVFGEDAPVAGTARVGLLPLRVGRHEWPDGAPEVRADGREGSEAFRLVEDEEALLLQERRRPDRIFFRSPHLEPGGALIHDVGKEIPHVGQGRPQRGNEEPAPSR